MVDSIEQVSRHDIVSLDDKFITIRVPVEALPDACAIAWERQGSPNLVITDLSAFAKDFVMELRREEENGDTIVTSMLDRAAYLAANNGAAGLDEHPMPSVTIDQPPDPDQTPKRA